MPYTGPAAFHDIGALLVEEINQALPSPIDRACMVPATIAWDDCECGMLAGSVNRIYFTDLFPQESTETTPGPCRGGTLAGELIFQVLRCAPLPSGTGEPPTCTELASSSLEVVQDGWWLHTTLACTLEDLRDSTQIMDYLVRPVQFVGPAGACVGSQAQAVIQINRGILT